MSDEIEKMPGNWFIKFKEIRKFRNFEDFEIMDSEGIDRIVTYNKEVYNAFDYYFEIWDNCHHYGLPNGGDWTVNPPWLVNFVKMFDRVYHQIENYRIEKRRK